MATGRDSPSLSRLWNSVVCLVKENVDFELLPIPRNHSYRPLPHRQFTFPLENQNQWTYDVNAWTNSKSDDHTPTFATGHSPCPVSATKDTVRFFPEVLEETDEDYIDSTDYEFSSLSSIGSQSAIGGPPPPAMPAGGPPPPPPPGPPIATVTPLTKAQQKISRMMLSLKQTLDDGQTTSNATDGSSLSYETLDTEEKKWAIVQAKHLNITMQDFLARVNKERNEVNRELSTLKQLMDDEDVKVLDLNQLEAAVETLSEAGEWYQGSTKLLRKANPTYEELEPSIDSMMEYVHFRKEMTEDSNEINYTDTQDLLSYTKKQFEKKHRRWGNVIISDARNWREHKLPVCDTLLAKARSSLCALVVMFVRLTVTEVRKIDVRRETLVSKKAVDRLEESLQMLQTAQSYFVQTQTDGGTACVCDACSNSSGVLTSEPYDKTLLLKLAVSVSESHVEAGLGKFEAYIYKFDKQAICDHFRSILTLLKKVEDLASSNPREETDSSEKRVNSAIARLPDSEGLTRKIKKTRLTLCRHVENEAAVLKQFPRESDNEQKRDKTKEIVYWMMFYCQYNYKVSLAMGLSDEDQESEEVTTTVQLAVSYIEDILKQYDDFVHVLDRKRIRSHFDCILKVVDSLVTNNPTGDSVSEKSLKTLPDGDILIEPIIRSCERLAEHYGNHEKDVVDDLLAEDDGKIKEEKKKEATKWLLFGLDYFSKMVGALGSNQFNSVMTSLKEMEKITGRVQATS